MLECPNCHAGMKGEERFCPNCGTRVDQVTSSADPPAAPATAPRTIVLPAAANVDRGAHASEPLAPTTRLPAAELMPTAQFPAAQPVARPTLDATIGVGMPAAAAPTSSSAQAATGATIIGGAPALPQNPPPGAPSSLPHVTVSAGQPATSHGRRLWLIVALIAGLGLLAVVALIVGVALVVRSSPVAARPTAAAARTAQPAAGNATAAPAPTVLGGNQGFLLLEENFDNPEKNGFTAEKTDSAVYAIVDSAYAITLKTTNQVAWTTFRGNYRDAAVEVETTLKGPDESAAGLIFRYQDKNNFYLFTVAGDGSYNLVVYDENYKQDEPKTLVDWTDSPTIKGPGERNILRVETEGDKIRLFVNGQLLDEISDDTFDSGKMGLAVNTFKEPDATVTFDNLSVRSMK